MRVIRGILSVILSVLIFVLGYATVGTAALKYKVTDADYYVDRIVTDEYVKALYKDVYDNVTIVCENLEVERDTVMSFVDNSRLKAISESNFRAVYASLMTGTPLQYERFENEALKSEIYKELEAFANEMGIVGEDIAHATELTYEYIIDDINETLTYFTQENMNIVSFVSQIPAIGFVINNAFFIAAALLVVLCVIRLFIMGRKRIRSSFYNVSLMLWLSSACWFIPVTVIKLQDVTINLAIAYSGFKVYIRNIINAVIDGIFNVSLVSFIISAVILITSIVILLVTISKRSKQQAEMPAESIQEN